MVGQGCEWRLDPQTGRAACHGRHHRTGMANSRFGPWAPTAGLPGRGPGWAFDAHAPVRSSSAAATADYKLGASFQLRGQRAKTQDHLLGRRERRRPQQPDELTTVDGTIRFSGWYMDFAPDLTIYADDRQYKVDGLYRLRGAEI